MDTKIQEFLNNEVGQITKFLSDKGWTMQQIIDEVQSFIHHSQWGKKIKRQVKFLTLNYLKIQQALNTNNVQLGV